MARTVGSHGHKTMSAIRKAGLQLVYKHGYEAMSLRQLATEVGISQGSLYNYFHTKQDLLLELIRSHMEHLLAKLDAELSGVGGAGNRLRAFIVFHVTYHVARRRAVFISYSELRSLEPRNYRIVTGLRDQYEQRLVAILDEGVADGSFLTKDTKVAAFGILAMLSGICTWFRTGGRLSKDDVIEVYADLITSGLVAGKRGGPRR